MPAMAEGLEWPLRETLSRRTISLHVMISVNVIQWSLILIPHAILPEPSKQSRQE